MVFAASATSAITSLTLQDFIIKKKKVDTNTALRLLHYSAFLHRNFIFAMPKANLA